MVASKHGSADDLRAKLTALLQAAEPMGADDEELKAGLSPLSCAASLSAHSRPRQGCHFYRGPGPGPGRNCS